MHVDAEAVHDVEHVEGWNPPVPDEAADVVPLPQHAIPLVIDGADDGCVPGRLTGVWAAFWGVKDLDDGHGRDPLLMMMETRSGE